MSICTNLNTDENGDYIDVITLETIPAERLVHLPYRNVVFCYDAVALLRYVQNERDHDRAARLPDNFMLLTEAGIEEIRRVARLSFEQTYLVVRTGDTYTANNIIAQLYDEEDAEDYIEEHPGTSYISFPNIGGSNYESENEEEEEENEEEDNDLDDKNEDEDEEYGADLDLVHLLYPNGIDQTSINPIPGPYFDEEGMRIRQTRQRENQDDDYPDQPALHRQYGRII